MNKRRPAIRASFLVIAIAVAGNPSYGSDSGAFVQWPKDGEPRPGRGQVRREPVQPEDDSGRSRPSLSQPVVRASAAEIAANPHQYHGRTVQVRAEIVEAYSKHVFILNEDRAFVRSGLLVLVPRPNVIAPEGRIVTVRGKIRPYNAPNFEHDYPWFTPSIKSAIDQASRPDSDRPVIIAESVRTDTGREYVDLRSGQTGPQNAVPRSGRARGEPNAQAEAGPIRNGQF